MACFLVKVDLSGEEEVSRIKLTFASNVFPQPGGPASSIPGGTVSPSASNSSGFCTGALEEVKQMFYKRS